MGLRKQRVNRTKQNSTKETATAQLFLCCFSLIQSLWPEQFFRKATVANAGKSD